MPAEECGGGDRPAGAVPPDPAPAVPAADPVPAVPAVSPGSTGWRGFPPSMIGERVVVRRELLPGGPPYGDVLGELLEVTPAFLRIATRRGEVTVALETVVAARRVQPPASRGLTAGPPG